MNALDQVSLLQLLESLPQPLMICGPGGESLAINGAARYMLGVGEAIAPGQLKLCLNERETFVSTRQRRHPHGLQEFFMADVRISGAAREFISLTLSPLDFGGYRVQLIDGPEAAGALVEGLARHEPLLAQLSLPAALCDHRRIVRAVNEPFIALFEQRREALLDQDVLTLAPAPQRQALRVQLAQLLAGHPPEQMSLSLDSRRILLRSSLLWPGAPQERPEGFLILAMPAPEELNSKLAEAEQLHRLGMLASNVAHELKNPLTSILNYADFLLTKYRDQLFERRDHERLERIIAGVERMDRFIQELVELGRAPQDKPFSPVDLHDVIEEAYALCEAQLEQADVRVSLALTAHHPMVMGLRVQLVQIIVNLITNAQHAMHSQGSPRLLIQTQQRVEDDGFIELRIKDNGEGVRPEHLPHVFEPFFTTKKAQGGSGLGLVLVRSMIEHHGGQVTLESVAGQGTCVIVRLPTLPHS